MRDFRFVNEYLSRFRYELSVLGCLSPDFFLPHNCLPETKEIDLVLYINSFKYLVYGKTE